MLNKAIVAIPGRDIGNTIWNRVRYSPLPSMKADSISASGTDV